MSQRCILMKYNFGFSSSEQREQLVEQCGAQQWLNMHRRAADDVVDVLVPSLEDALSDRAQQRIVETSLFDDFGDIPSTKQLQQQQQQVRTGCDALFV